MQAPASTGTQPQYKQFYLLILFPMFSLLFQYSINAASVLMVKIFPQQLVMVRTCKRFAAPKIYRFHKQATVFSFIVNAFPPVAIRNFWKALFSAANKIDLYTAAKQQMPHVNKIALFVHI